MYGSYTHPSDYRFARQQSPGSPPVETSPRVWGFWSRLAGRLLMALGL